MKILILNWKDIKNPQAGGAELVIHELAKRFAAEKNQVTLLTSAFAGCKKIEKMDGVEVIRIGTSRYTHNFKAINYYRKNLKNKFDIIIECVNTAPYFINFFKGKEQVFLFYHQLAREIWFYETRFPISLIGYLAEPVYTFLQSRFKNKVVTVSESTKKDLMRYGFKAEHISIITQGTNTNKRHPEQSRRIASRNSLLTTLGSQANNEKRKARSYILYLGSLRTMKRPLHALRAFLLFVNSSSRIANTNVIAIPSSPKEKQSPLDCHRGFIPRSNSKNTTSGRSRNHAKRLPAQAGQVNQCAMTETTACSGLVKNSKKPDANCELLVAGTGPEKEIKKLKVFIKNNKLDNKVKLLGKVSEQQKLELLKKAFVLVVPSLKEGWGLVVTEAAKFGVPAIVYDVDGLRDSVKNGKTGFVVENNNPKAIAEKIELLQHDLKLYEQIRKNCIKSSKINTFDNAYRDLVKLLTRITETQLF